MENHELTWDLSIKIYVFFYFFYFVCDHGLTLLDSGTPCNIYGIVKNISMRVMFLV